MTWPEKTARRHFRRSEPGRDWLGAFYDSKVCQVIDPQEERTCAACVGNGVSAKSWARANAVPPNTAYRWAREPEVRKEVASCRQRLVSRALGRMARHTTRAADTIVRISREGDSDAVQLKAALAILSDLIAVARFSDLEERMLEVEEMLHPPSGAASDSMLARALTNQAQGRMSTTAI